MIRWAGGILGHDLSEAAEGGPYDAELLALAQSVPAGSDGLLMLPYLFAERAPLWDPDLQGAFLGIRHSHTHGHFIRAAVEGVALQLSSIVDQLDRIEPVTSIRATGGVFRSQLWRQVMAGALARPLHVTGGADGSALGAAVLGLVALGRVASPSGGMAALAADADEGVATVPTSANDEQVYTRMRASVPALLRAYDDVARFFAGVSGAAQVTDEG